MKTSFKHAAKWRFCNSNSVPSHSQLLEPVFYIYVFSLITLCVCPRPHAARDKSTQGCLRHSSHWPRCNSVFQPRPPSTPDVGVCVPLCCNAPELAHNKERRPFMEGTYSCFVTMTLPGRINKGKSEWGLKKKPRKEIPAVSCAFL